MRKTLAVLSLIAVMLAAAATIVLRGSTGFEAGSGAVLQGAMASTDWPSLVLGLSAGMIIMWIYHLRRGALPLAIHGRMQAWRRRLAMLALVAVGAAALVYY